MDLEKEIESLLRVMATMRDPKKGCSWTKSQTFNSLIRHTIEEAYEVADTIERQDYKSLKGELADLLNQIVFYSQLAEEEGHFNFLDVVIHLRKKLIIRHPDVFEDRKDKSIQELNHQWEEQKLHERENSDDKSILSDIAYNLPSLSLANKMQHRVSHVGFDWNSKDEVLTKIREEVQELDEALTSSKEDLILEELGDVLFSCVNLCRHMNVDPEQIMRKTCRKFESRFRYLETILAKKNINLNHATEEDFQIAWDLAKKKINS